MLISLCLVPFNNSKNFARILGQISNKIPYKIETIIIDNSTDKYEIAAIQKTVKNYKEKLNTKYYGNNSISLSEAVNKAIDRAKGQYFIYLCSNHIWIYSDNFIQRMIEPMNKSGADMGGTICYEVAKHIQGGIYIAKTDILKSFRYDEKRYPFSFMDVDISQRMIKAGAELINIPAVYSIMGNIMPDLHKEWLKNKEVAICHSHFYQNIKE